MKNFRNAECRKGEIAKQRAALPPLRAFVSFAISRSAFSLAKDARCFGLATRVNERPKRRNERRIPANASFIAQMDGGFPRMDSEKAEMEHALGEIEHGLGEMVRALGCWQLQTDARFGKTGLGKR